MAEGDNTIKKYLIIGTTVVSLGIGGYLLNDYVRSVKSRTLDTMLLEHFIMDSGNASKIILKADGYLREHKISPSDEAYDVMFKRGMERMQDHPELVYEIPDASRELIRDDIKDEYKEIINGYVESIKEGVAEKGKKVGNMFDEFKHYLIDKWEGK